MAAMEQLAKQLRARNLTVAVAECTTGGLIASELLSLPGSSAYFRAGIIPYDHASKTAVMGIPEALFVEHGSVSPEAALAMAVAARQLFQAHIGIAETGVAGPAGGRAGKPVGLNYVAVSSEHGEIVRENLFHGDRTANRQAAVQAALDLLADHLGELSSKAAGAAAS